jgi:hypothetical protein
MPASPRSFIREQARRNSYHRHTDEPIVDDIDLSLTTRGNNPVIPQLPGYRRSGAARV